MASQCVQPALTRLQPRIGFHVRSVQEIVVVVALIPLPSLPHTAGIALAPPPAHTPAHTRAHCRASWAAHQGADGGSSRPAARRESLSDTQPASLLASARYGRADRQLS